jgi:hypothetical protein
MGVIKRQSKKDGHGAATSVRSRVPWRGNLKTRMPTSMSSLPNQLYLAGLRDAVAAGPL